MLIDMTWFMLLGIDSFQAREPTCVMNVNHEGTIFLKNVVLPERAVMFVLTVSWYFELMFEA